MAERITKHGAICVAALKKFPKTPILTLAKKLYSENPLHFKNIEHARKLLSYHSGKSGKRNRKRLLDKSMMQEVSYNYAPFEDIPESFEEIREPYILSTATKKILILSDIHFPYHNAAALRAAIKYGLEQGVDCIILNGDILDFYALSDFSKDPSKPTFRKEIKLGKWFLNELRMAFPKAQIYYKIGNHEMRLERYLMVKAPEILDCEEFRLEILLEFAKHHVILIDKYTVIKAGNLNIIHGHEYKGAGGVYPAKYIYGKSKVNTICGHYHRSSTYLDKNMDGHYHGGFSTGCLCELSPDYMPYNEWVHGFAVVTMKPGGNFSVQNLTIENGEIR
jgi:predicted phosphodiesterase